jgi:hypothetical protein
MVNAPAQLATATALGVNPSGSTGVLANAQLASALGSAGLPATNATSLAFPNKNLQVRVDLLLGGVWTDITKFVYQRNPVEISGVGRTDWTGNLNPAQCTFTVNNRDGRFTPKLSTGAYFPNIVRNTQVRVFLTVTSATNVSYAGFRFYGEIAEWPIHWDASQRDVAVDVTANGIWRRLSQVATTIGSAYRRFKVNTAGTTALQSYWPVEDGTGSGQLVPYGSASGTANAVQQFVAGEAGLSLASSDSFPGSDAIATFNGAVITATVPNSGTATNNVTRFGITVPTAGDSAAGGGNWNIVEIDSAGSVAKFEVYLIGNGTIKMQLVNSGGAVMAAATTTTNANGSSWLISCELTPSGGNVNFAMRMIKAGASGITESLTGTVTGASIGRVTKVIANRSYTLTDTAFGQLSVAYGSPTSLVQEAYVLNGYQGEFALDRFKRLCGELGIVSSTIGSSSSSAPMGPQLDDTLSNVLQQIEDTDCGLLYELRDQFGLGYRTNASMANQAAQFVLNYAGQTVDPDLSPSYDDQFTRNNITVSNWTGYTQQAILTAGAMSVLNPPNGIGNGYNYQRSVSAANDNQCPGIANFLLNVGGVDEIRFPTVTVKMIRPQLANFYSSIPNSDIGDYFQITNPPAFLTTTTIKQLIWGYSEVLNARDWTFQFSTVPETPWETGFSPGTIQTAQIPGGSPVSSQAQNSLGLSQLIANGSITPGMLSAGITVHTLGGNAITLAASAPSAPNINDYWINSVTGLISQWNGSSWVPVKFDASQTIIAGTIVTANIAASAITSSLIAAGTVVAGIVDATQIKASEYDAFSTGGQFFAYDTSTPTTGHLTTSIAGASGTDSASNAFPKGLLSQQLTLKDQGSAPPSFSGASVLYTSSSGRLRYLASNGNDLVLDRCVLDLTNFTMGTQTLAQQMSSNLAYIANEAQTGSEYEIEIDGTVTTPSSTTTSLPVYNWSFFIDGVGTGINNVTVGAVLLSSNLTVAYCIRARMTVNATGAGGTCDIVFDGGVSIQFNGAAQFNLGNTSPVHTGGGGGQGSTPVNQLTVGVAFDTTSNHNFAIYGNWGTSTGTSLNQSAITYRTRKTRRN